MPGARVECAGESVTLTTKADSDSQAGRCSATVSRPGFHNAYELNLLRTARIELPLAALSERVVVSATRRETTVEEAGVAASVVSTRRTRAARQFAACSAMFCARCRVFRWRATAVRAASPSCSRAAASAPARS